MVCNDRLNSCEETDSESKNPISQLFWNSQNNNICMIDRVVAEWISRRNLDSKKQYLALKISVQSELFCSDDRLSVCSFTLFNNYSHKTL